jgi:multisubunit Na+/H+ antiporter MnhF subunit
VIGIASLCLVLLALCILACLYRIAVGPHVLDRILALDLVAVLVAAIMAVTSVIRGNWLYLEIAMGIAVLALVATIAVAHVVDRERVF